MPLAGSQSRKVKAGSSKAGAWDDCAEIISEAQGEQV